MSARSGGKSTVQSVELCPAAVGDRHEPLLRAKTLFGLIPKTGFFTLATQPVFLKLDVLLKSADDCGHLGSLRLLGLVKLQAGGFDIVVRVMAIGLLMNRP